MVLAGLTSSSDNNGSSTDMGLGRSFLSTALSGSSTFLRLEESVGEAGGEDRVFWSFPDGCWNKEAQDLDIVAP